MKILPEARAILEKYRGKIASRYADHINFSRAIDVGLKSIAKRLGLPPIIHYDARTCVGNWARNICKFHKEDVGFVLNHISQERRSTDAYIEVNWELIDEVQQEVVGLLLMDEVVPAKLRKTG